MFDKNPSRTTTMCGLFILFHFIFIYLDASRTSTISGLFKAPVGLWTRVFHHVRPHSMGETRFFCFFFFFVLLENHLKNGLESPLIFVLF